MSMATMVQNYAHPEKGCFNVGELLSSEVPKDERGEKGERGVEKTMLAELVECGAAVALDREGVPVKPKPEKATKAKSGETATKAG